MINPSSMKASISLLLALTATFVSAEETQLFNGKDLTGWSGDPALWSVKDGILIGKTTAESPIKENTFLIWKGGDVSDFELTLKYRMLPANEKKALNSGIQYRSILVDEAAFSVSGYQADLEYGDNYSGILYEEKGRGILAQRGQKVTITEGADAKTPNLTVTAEIGVSSEIQTGIQKDGWNEYRIVAKGNHLQHFINGKQTIDVTDLTKEGAKKGVLALQLHVGPPMQIEFKDIVLNTK